MFQGPDENTTIYISQYDRAPKGRPKTYTNDEIALIRNEIAKKYYQDNLNHWEETQKSYYQRDKEKIFKQRRINYAKRIKIQQLL